jgi:D-sedoheptulose 7-phosphate isomerase
MVVGSWLRRQIQLSEHSSTIDVLEGHLAEVKHVLGQIPIGSVERIVDVILDAHRSRRRVYILGNGGSASTAGHFAADLSKATIVEGQPRLRVQSLADNQALITAWANDSSFDRVFAEQLENLIDPQDVVVAISVSGNSPNVLSAMRTARSRGAVTVGLVGASGGSLADVVDTAVRVPSDSYGVVEDCHLVLEHAITESTRRALLEPSRTAPVSLAHHPALFLDRDGVINRRRPEHVKSWAEFEFLPGALDALAEVKRAGIKVIVITNQAAVGRGLLREQELTEIHGRMLGAVAGAGGHIERVYTCPHTPEERCECRKPGTALFSRASLELGVSLRGSVMVGDSKGDVEAAQSAGCDPVLVGVRRPAGVSAEVPVVSDLVSALPLIGRLSQTEDRWS